MHYFPKHHGSILNSIPVCLLLFIGAHALGAAAQPEGVVLNPKISGVAEGVGPAVEGGWYQILYNDAADKKIHLSNPQGRLTTFPWTPGKDLVQTHGEPPFAGYRYDKATETETFELYERRSNRSEIRMFNEYEFCGHQFEGYVTFDAPMNDESLFQIWGSDQGATQLMVRGYAANGGSIGVNYKGGGTPRFLKDLYGKETKVNVVHLQEDFGNKIMVFLNDEKVVEFADNEKATNHDNKSYHKYGCYGTVREGHENPRVKWRAVRHFVAGKAPAAAEGVKAVAADGGVDVSWEDRSENEERFVIERAEVGKEFEVVGRVPTDATRFEDRTTAAGKSYRYRVGAENVIGRTASAEAQVPDAARGAMQPMALNGKLVYESDFMFADYTKEKQEAGHGWQMRVAHPGWRRMSDGVASAWESGHMPVLVYEGEFRDAVIEVDFKFEEAADKWSGCRISATNAALNPRAYAASVWANANGKNRATGLVLEHDEWKPGIVTNVDHSSATLEAGKWYTLRMELIGDAVQATCNGATVYGRHEKFGLLPKTSIWVGVGTGPHELRNLRVYEATLNPEWEKPT